jgi:thiamine biosynthesis lipoprotein
LGVVACHETNGLGEAVRFAGPTMGTGYSVSVSAFPARLDRRRFKAEVEAVLERVNHDMSNWRPASDISLFNRRRNASVSPVSPDTFRVLETALEISRKTNGAFDPTVGHLVDLWGFGPAAGGQAVPPDSLIERALAGTGYQYLRLSNDALAVDRTRAGLEVNLSGIAKGYAVDKVAALLESQGIQDYLVDIGGDLRLRGRSPHRAPWRIGIEKPIVGQRSLQRIIALSDGAVATSGNYRNFFQNDGLIYSHIIDPRDGMPVRHKLASVTVIAGTTMEADALSTGLMAMGPDAGLALARQAGLAALFLVQEGQGFAEVASPAFDRYALG